MPARHGRGEYLRRLREAAHAQGLCYECTCRPVMFGRRRCEFCNEKNRTRLRAIRATGVCASLCGAPRLPDNTRCEGCRDKQREYMRKRREARGVKPRTIRASLAASVVPSELAPVLPTDGPRKADPAPPAEAALSIDRTARLRAIAERAKEHASG